MTELLGMALSLLYLMLVLTAGALIARHGRGEGARFVSRKTVHILTCFLWFFLYYFLRGSHATVLLCGTLFLLLLLFRKRLFSISDAENRASGALLYAGVGTVLAGAACFYPALYMPLGIAVCALSLGDGFAGLFGRFLPLPRVRLFREKTLVGTLSAFLFSLLSVLGFAHGYGLPISLSEALVIASAFAFAELVTPFSADNISTAAVTFLLANMALQGDLLERYAFSLVLIPLTGIAVLAKRALTGGGMLAAAAVAVAVACSLGDGGFLLLFSFFALTALCDLVKKEKKRALLCDVHERPYGRDGAQVLATGLLPAAAAILFALTENPLFTVAFAAALAENLGDCMASELGVLSRRPPFDIFRRKRTVAGMSGGVSLLGSVAAIAGIALITALYRVLPLYAEGSLSAVAGAALLGVLADTALGALAQRKNRCPVCGKITERATHCGERTAHAGGLPWLSNTAVNLIANATAAVLGALLYGVCVL